MWLLTGSNSVYTITEGNPPPPKSLTLHFGLQNQNASSIATESVAVVAMPPNSVCFFEECSFQTFSTTKSNRSCKTLKCVDFLVSRQVNIPSGNSVNMKSPPEFQYTSVPFCIHSYLFASLMSDLLRARLYILPTYVQSFQSNTPPRECPAYICWSSPLFCLLEGDQFTIRQSII